MADIELSKYEQRLFDLARKGNYNAFSTHFFKLPYSGTIYTPLDRVDEYALLYEVWRIEGQPGEKFEAMVGANNVIFKVLWGMYGTEPSFLYPHGYIFLPWALQMLNAGRMICVAEGGTGSAKTSSVGIAALIKCAAYPGFDFLNVAPTTTQAADMLEEVVKWIEHSEFRKFIRLTANKDLWKWKPYPTMVIDCGLGGYSTFGCMTLGDKGDIVLGKGRDWLSVDEASLVQNIGESIAKLATRYRGTRRTGMPRYSSPAFSAITNPHDQNASFDELKATAIRETENPKGKYIFIRPSTTDNVYVTTQQLELQRTLLNEEEQRRWLDGSDEQFKRRGVIPVKNIEGCQHESLNDLLEVRDDDDIIVERKADLGIYHYELPRLPDHIYLVFGDPGSNNFTSLSVNNVPVTGCLDITGFPDQPATLVAMYMIDGNGKYRPWIESMIHLMLKYQPLMAAYDATGMGKIFSEWPDMEKYPLYPVTLTGNHKMESRTLFQLFIGDQLFAWPYLRVLWHQAGAYRETGPSLNKIPDDLIAGLFVASFYMRFQFWNALSRLYNWRKTKNTKEKIRDEHRERRSRYQTSRARYARISPRRDDDEIMDTLS